MNARESYPVPAASAASYAGYIWRLGVHTGAVEYPDAFDASEPDENSGVSEYLSSLVGQSEDKVVYDLRDAVASTLVAGLYELGMPTKRIVKARVADVTRIHAYMTGPVSRSGLRIAEEQLLVPRDFAKSSENPFNAIGFLEAIWRFRDDRRQIADLGLKSFPGAAHITE